MPISDVEKHVNSSLYINRLLLTSIQLDSIQLTKDYEEHQDKVRLFTIAPNIHIDKHIHDKVKNYKYKDKECLRIIISNLILCCNDNNSILLYSRCKGLKLLNRYWNRKDITTHRVIKTIDWMEEQGYVFNNVTSEYQLNSEYKYSSSITPTQKFIDKYCNVKGKKVAQVVKQKRVDHLNAFPVLIMRDKDKQDMELSNTKDVREYIAAMQLMNNSNEKFTVLHKGVRINTEYKRVFNEGSFKYNGRMYSSNIMSIENRESKDRLKITIDNAPVAEVDYSSLHIRLLNDNHGEYLPATDLYYLMLPDHKKTKENRSLIKMCCVSLLNVSSEKAAMLSFRQHINEIKGHNIESPREILDYIYSCIGEQSRKELYNDHIGLRLCNVESMIMSKVVGSFVELGLPIFPIHDSALVRQQDYELLACMMADYYKQVMKLPENSIVPMQVSMFVDGLLVKKDVSQ